MTDQVALDPATSRWARHRSTVLIVAVLLAIAALLAWASGDRGAGPLDPDNPAPDGARALVRVLAEQGVEVEVVRTAGQLEEALPSGPERAASTVVITQTEFLGQATIDRTLAAVDPAGLIVVDPAKEASERFGFGAPVPAEAADPIAAGCPRFSGLRIEVEHAASYPTSQGCFGTGPGHVLGSGDGGAQVLGAGALLSNEAITRQDNAAVALRLLGQRERLAWYVPSLADLPAGDGVTLRRFLPPWIVPGLILGGVAFLALALWRGRRLGALVTEPLPVAVRAIETTRARGRLYRDAADRAHAADILTRAAASRLAVAAHLPRDADPAALRREVARRTGRPEAQVAALLAPPPPTTDHDLIALADGLAALEKEVLSP